MKNTLFALSMFLIVCNNAAKAQHEPQDKMGIMLSAGYKHLSNVKLPNSHDAFTFDLTLHNHFNNIDFNSSFNYGKNYISFEPCSLIGMLYYYFVKYGEGDDSEGGLGTLFFMAMAVSTMSFNIPIGDDEAFIIRPYWSLLRISKVKDYSNRYELNAAVGTYLSYDFGPLMVNPFCEYGFGYSKNSPWKGFNFGISLSTKFY